MISVQEVIQDPDFIAPQPFTILRSTGQFVAGGFQSTTVPISQFGPVQQASNKEIQMLQEADRIGSILAFWCTIPVRVTSGTLSVPSVHGESVVGALPGTVFTLSQLPPTDNLRVIVGGLLMRPVLDYTLSGNVLTLTTVTHTPPWVQWPVTANVAQAASDILVYPPSGQQYRILSTYHDPGCGYWKALGARMNAA